MFGYYLDLALRSLKRSPVLTALMVLAIGLGIGASDDHDHRAARDDGRSAAGPERAVCSIRRSIRRKRRAITPATSRRTSSPGATR